MGGATTVDFAACTTCENQVCGAGAGASTSFVGQLAAASKECFTSTDVAAAGPAKGTPRSQLCQALLSCVHASGCNKNASADQDCWCGIGVDATLCATASATSAFKPSGPCKQEIDAAAESSDPTIVPNRFTDTTFVSGDAFLLLDSCDNPTPPSKKLFVGKCQSECTASGGGGSSVGASGASGAGGSLVGASGASGASGSPDGEGSPGVGGGVGGSGGPTGAAGDPGGGTPDAAIETGAAGVSGGAAGAAGTAGAVGGSAGGGADASSGPAPIPEGGMPCAAPTGRMCPDLDGNSVLDCNETLVANPGFDTNISSWLPETGVSLTWDQTGDDDGNTSSGAIVVKNLTIANTAGWTMEGTYECVPVEAGSTYDFTTQLSMPADQAAGGAGLIALLYYPSTDCSGAPGGGTVSEQVTATATCEVLSMSRAIPSGIASASVRLTALKPFSADPFEVEFDNVLFKKH